MKYAVTRNEQAFRPITMSITVESQEELDAMYNLAQNNGAPSNDVEKEIMYQAGRAQRDLREIL